MLQAYSDEDAVKDAVGEDSVDDQASPAASPPPLSGCDAEWAALDWVPPPKSSLSCSALDGFTQSYFGKEPIEMLPVNVLSEILLSPGTSAGLPQCHTVYSDCGVPISGPAGQRCAKTVIFEAAAWVQAAIRCRVRAPMCRATACPYCLLTISRCSPISLRRRFEQDGPWWSSDPQGGDALTFECAGQGVFEGVRFSAGWRLGPIVRIASLQSRGTVIVAAPGSQGDQATPAPTTKGPLVGEAPISVTAAQSTPAGTEESASGAATEQGLETEDSERSEEEAEEGDSNVVEGTRDTEDEAVPSPSSFIAPPTPGPVEEGGVLEAVLSGSVGPGQQVWCVADEALGQIGAGFWTYGERLGCVSPVASYLGRGESGESAPVARCCSRGRDSGKLVSCGWAS